MDGPDEVIPRMTPGEFTDPILLPGEIIHFQSETDDELRMLALRAPDLLNIIIELISAHSPVIKVIAPHRRVVGESNLGQPRTQRVRSILRRLARCVTAKRCVHVIIRGQLHGGCIAQRGRRMEKNAVRPALTLYGSLTSL